MNPRKSIPSAEVTRKSLKTVGNVARGVLPQDYIPISRNWDTMGTGPEPTITLTKEDDWWVARDTETGVASQGPTREAALENLDEAVALHRDETRESIDSWDEERDALEALGIDPDEVADAREESPELPDCMQ
jgi:predicted RNase H-like HicB family nuclease